MTAGHMHHKPRKKTISAPKGDTSLPTELHVAWEHYKAPVGWLLCPVISSHPNSVDLESGCYDTLRSLSVTGWGMKASVL